jgi:hypothetical protein
MQTKLTGDVTLTYVMGGISKKSDKPYLQLSDGIEAKFVNLDDDLDIKESTFSDFERGQEIDVTIEVDVLSGRVKILSF